jgi:hypothetical protein
MRKSPAVLALVLVLSALPAAADEVVYFNNGASMAIRTHEIDGDMIRVNLGAGAVMAFPITMVERVVSGGQDVFTGPGYQPSNQALPGQPGAADGTRVVTRDNTITGSGNVPARFRSGGVTTGMRTGDPDSFQAAGSANASSRSANPFSPANRFRRAGTPRRNLTESPIGAYSVGDQYVIGETSPEANPNKPVILNLGPPEGGSSAPAGDAGSSGGAEAPPETD